jgi:ketosteroid isomerase-like protein
MMRKAWRLFILLSLVFATVVVLGQGQTKRRQKDNFVDLQEQVQRVLRDLRNRDAEAALGIYGRRAEYVHIDNGKVVPWAQLEPQVRQYLANVKKNELYWVGTPKILKLEPNAAVVYGTHRFEGDGTRESHRGEWTGVFQRINGRWKLVHSHSSDQTH